ncbi:MAG: FkbM family methyltransferase [Thalassobaculaceae bacterium]|nr:FkbM family methyltransferase [Thalassobaculaceae bacterium]
MSNVPFSEATASAVKRALAFAEDGNLFGVLATLGHAMGLTPNAIVRSMLLRALATLNDAKGLRSLLRQCATVDPKIPEMYENHHASVARRLAHRASLPDRAVQTDAFVNCVTFKALVNTVDDPLANNVLATVGDYFGRLSAQEAFGGALPTTGRDADVYSTRIGSHCVKLRNSGGHDHKHYLLFFLLEPGLVRWIAGFDAQDVFLDVGANIGKYAVLAATTTGVRTYALEPFSTNFDALVDNVALNELSGTMTPMRIALSDRTGSAKLRYTTHVPGQASQSLVSACSGDQTTEPVEAARLDDLIADGTLPMPTRIKIDVDGEEWRLIDGMMRTLCDPRLHSIRMEVRDSPENQAAIRKIEDAGFVGASDDDAKNLLFLRRRRTIG